MSAHELIDVTYLRGLMQESGVTHQELANKIRMRRQTITEILNLPADEEMTVKTGTLARIAQGLGVPIWALFVGAPRTGPQDRAA